MSNLLLDILSREEVYPITLLGNNWNRPFRYNERLLGLGLKIILLPLQFLDVEEVVWHLLVLPDCVLRATYYYTILALAEE
jgi:hypothetical protein